MANHDLIKCSDHKLAPWSIVCTHLINGQSREWKHLDSNNPEVDHDWLCPDCMTQYINENRQNLKTDITHLRPVCIHCVRKLRTMYDNTYHPQEP